MVELLDGPTRTVRTVWVVPGWSRCACYNRYGLMAHTTDSGSTASIGMHGYAQRKDISAYGHVALGHPHDRDQQTFAICQGRVQPTQPYSHHRSACPMRHGRDQQGSCGHTTWNVTLSAKCAPVQPGPTAARTHYGTVWRQCNTSSERAFAVSGAQPPGIRLGPGLPMRQQG